MTRNGLDLADRKRTNILQHVMTRARAVTRIISLGDMFRIILKG